MSLHIAAKTNEIAETVLLPGDPLRAKFIAENILEDAKCYNEIRGMYGFTGTYKGKRVSVQGTGMGIPSIGIYVNELISSYNVKNLIRIGTAGALQKDIKLKDVVIAMGACTDSQINKIAFKGMDYAPTASFDLLKKAYDAAISKNINVKVGNVFSTDIFYNDHDEEWQMWARYGVLCVEMETAALYSIAAKHNRNALSILTISDSLVTKESSTAIDRQTAFRQMVDIALEV